MARRVEVYWSHQSPYCYFALDCLGYRPDRSLTSGGEAVPEAKGLDFSPQRHREH